MDLFNLDDYQIPTADEVDMAKTKNNVGVFLMAYKSVRQRIGCPREPKITSTFADTPAFSNEFHSQVEQIVIKNDSDREEFLRLNEIYRRGISSIQHPFLPEVTDRRKSVFYKRYIQGLAIYQIALEIGYSEDVVAEESRESLIQFANAIGILAKSDFKRSSSGF
ncbi:ArpU family phage packaging/lysis transcriptional regulator [Enterococcus nangangensis]|uniref:ArpU family phage packaging/lysis transcriptional regulator n=1 Tax=Enterococcus nangangensis TaxID=2559926 RepID=UPI0010F790D3|nr:ArpU family phage packaging/lysis transcriptional regulator [Enterococcus nangangensis]